MISSNFSRSLLCSLIAFSCSPIFSSSRTMSVDVRHSEGGGVGYSQSYTSLDGFFGYDGDNYLPFLDARGHVFNDGKFAANVGIGTRGLYESSCLALGGNIFYDYRNTHRHSYNQIGVGFEVIKPWWEIHVNGYFPVGTKKSRFFNYREQEFLVSGGGAAAGGAGAPVFDHFAGHELFLLVPGTSSSTFERIKKKKQEFALTGVDADINVHLVKAANINFEAAAGPYYYRGYYGRQAVGGKARVTARWSDYIAGEFAASYDNLFHGRIHGGLALIYPFGPKIPKKRENPELNCNSHPDLFYDRLVQRVDRAEIIVVDKKRFTKKETFTIAGTTTTTAPAIDPATGAPWDFIFVKNTGGGFGAADVTLGASNPAPDGTFENPFEFLSDAEAASVDRDIIYIYPGTTGTTEGYNSGFTMKDFQKMWGAGINHNLATTVGTVVVPAQASSNPKIGNFLSLLSNHEAVVLANNNEVSGLAMIDEFGGALTILMSGTNIANPNIMKNSFELTDNNEGIDIESSSSLGTLIFEENSLVATSALTELKIVGNGGNVLIKNNTFLSGDVGSAAEIESNGDQTLFTTVSNNTFTFLPFGVAFQSNNTSLLIASIFHNTYIESGVFAESSNNSTLDIGVFSNTFINSSFNPAMGFSSQNSSTMNVDVGNPFNGGNTINSNILFDSSDTSVLNPVIAGNTFHNISSSEAIFFSSNDSSHIGSNMNRALILENDFTNCTNDAIDIFSNGSSSAFYAIELNSFDTIGIVGINSQSGAASILNADILGNQFSDVAQVGSLGASLTSNSTINAQQNSITNSSTPNAGFFALSLNGSQFNATISNNQFTNITTAANLFSTDTSSFTTTIMDNDINGATSGGFTTNAQGTSTMNATCSNNNLSGLTTGVAAFVVSSTDGATCTAVANSNISSGGSILAESQGASTLTFTAITNSLQSVTNGIAINVSRK